jgi:hypothetical protein
MKDKCEIIKDLIPAFVCGELEASEAETVISHIEDCPDCKKEYDMMLGMENAISLAEYEAPSELHSEIMSAVNKERRKNKQKAKFVKRISVVAAAAAVVVLMINVIPNIINEGSGNASNELIVNEKTYIFDAVGSDGRTEDYVPLSESSIESFCGEWTIPLENGNRAVLKINDDMSAEVCIIDKYGIEIYYDGIITLAGEGSAHMTQSDGRLSFDASLEMFIKDGRLCINIKRGVLPFADNYGGL